VFIERPKNPRLVASKIVKVEHSLFISKSYDEKFGRPRDLKNLGQHRFVDYVPTAFAPTSPGGQERTTCAPDPIASGLGIRLLGGHS